MKFQHVFLIFFAPLCGISAPRQVIVYSFLTDAGQLLPYPTAGHPTRCALGSGGYHEWGGVRAGEKPVQLAQIEPLVRAALRVNAYEGLRVEEIPHLVIEFHWGCMRPDASGLRKGRTDVIINLVDMLDLVGGEMASYGHDACEHPAADPRLANLAALQGRRHREEGRSAL